MLEMEKDTFFIQPEGAGSSIETTCSFFSTELAIFHQPEFISRQELCKKRGGDQTNCVCVLYVCGVSLSLKRGATGVVV